MKMSNYCKNCIDYPCPDLDGDTEISDCDYKRTKEDNIINNIIRPWRDRKDLKIGDFVKILDHSWIMALLPGGLVEHEVAWGGVYKDDELYVRAINCVLPTDEGGSWDRKKDPANNILLWNKTRGYYVCVRSNFLIKIS
jgi:hypothetical protein